MKKIFLFIPDFDILTHDFLFFFSHFHQTFADNFETFFRCFGLLDFTDELGVVFDLEVYIIRFKESGELWWNFFILWVSDEMIELWEKFALKLWSFEIAIN